MPDNFSFRALDWDTEYFGIRSSRLDLHAMLDRSEMKEALALAKSYEFVCIGNKDCNVENARLIADMTSAYVVDTNVQFEKKIILSQLNTDARSIALNNYPIDQGILNITESAYRNYRFILDQKLAERSGKHIYTEWVKNAADKSDKYFIVEKSETDTHIEKSGKVKGYILFSINDESLHVELVGVAEDEQKKGVGWRLWEKLEQEAIGRNCSQICVGTQVGNAGAMSFYMKCGCKIVSTNQIYHWWRNKHHI